MEHGEREEQQIGVDNEDERQPLLPRQQPTTNSLRRGREQQEAGKLTKFVLCVFKFCFGSLGLWGNQAWNYIPRVAVYVICIYQAVYDFYVVVGCPGFDCGFLQNSTNKNHSHHKDDRQIANTVYTIASVGAVLSYSLFICCFMRATRKDSALVPPVDNMADDLHEKDAWKLCLYFGFISAFYLCSVVVFYAIVWGQKRGRFFDILTTGVAAQFIAQWTAITTCHVFAVSAYSLGVYEKINFTTSADWDEGHPFQDRRVLALFISYAKDRQCGFKIGRIRFNTSLAWLSFFFGLTGLLYHFIQ